MSLGVGERKADGLFGVTLWACCEFLSCVVGGLITSRTDNSYNSKHCLHSMQTLLISRDDWSSPPLDLPHEPLDLPDELLTTVNYEVKREYKF